MTLRYRIRKLYEGRGDQTRWFLYSLLIFDFLSLLFIIATSFLPRSQLIRGLDLLVGMIFLVEFTARFVAVRRPLRELLRITTWTDVAAIISLLASATGEAAGFLQHVIVPAHVIVPEKGHRHAADFNCGIATFRYPPECKGPL